MQSFVAKRLLAPASRQASDVGEASDRMKPGEHFFENDSESSESSESAESVAPAASATHPASPAVAPRSPQPGSAQLGSASPALAASGASGSNDIGGTISPTFAEFLSFDPHEESAAAEEGQGLPETAVPPSPQQLAPQQPAAPQPQQSAAAQRRASVRNWLKLHKTLHLLVVFVFDARIPFGFNNFHHF